ncbi:RNA polymerase sigma-70 factor (ECF subfamily) [Pedobacter sp. AK013]|uniref:RNA polymerase sigma factor n=1 Tax=Pedobacter sp. AK013 TaxID=2723071 RepID=UPI0016102309|nr:sigma-70 family RNA polymerase sigma factor [Pedobacter sp. AK013]MBB6236854.1 RNA polymerase sigma-70 factor (ECF subfamily) [Pedobacter sp. AK013]
MEEVSEENLLLLRIANDDRIAFSMLYKKYLHNLSLFVNSITKDTGLSDELVQDIFVKIWLNRKNLPLIDSFKSYLYRSASNLLIDYIRKQKTQLKIKDISQRFGETYSEAADEGLIYTQTLQYLHNGIKLLPEKRKKIVELKMHDDLSLDEIALQLKISKSVVKKQLYTGMTFLRNHLKHFYRIAPFISFLYFFL